MYIVSDLKLRYNFAYLKRLVSALALAFMVSFAWVFITRNQYDYNYSFANIFGLSSYPLLLWAVCLFFIFLVSEEFEKKFKINSFVKYFLGFTILYAISILVIETLGYYLLGVHNLGTLGYSGLPVCDCLHAPTWMQAGYFINGPLYFLICSFLKKNHII